MKKALVLPILAAIACMPAGSFAQSPTPAPSESPSATPSESPAATPSESPTPGRPARMAILTPAERKKLVDASQKARLDPAVQAAAAKLQDALKAYQQANIDFREAMRKSLSADPDVAAIIAKLPKPTTPATGMNMMPMSRRIAPAGSPAPSASGTSD